jgi:hypothetical protein
LLEEVNTLEEISELKKIEILEDLYIHKMDVKTASVASGVSEDTVYKYRKNREALRKFVENDLDGWVLENLMNNAPKDSAFMKMLLENIMHKSAVQKVEHSGSVVLTGDEIRKAIDGLK